MTLQQVSNQIQDQGQLIQSVSNMGQQIIMLQIALQRQYQQHQEEKREFIKKFTDYRKEAENRIFNIQNTCAQTILGIMRLRIQDNNATTVEELPLKQISVLEHQLQIKQTLTQGQQVLQQYKLKAETEFQELIQQNNALTQQIAQLQQFNDSLKLAIGESGKTIQELKKSVSIIRQNSEKQLGQTMGRVSPLSVSSNHSIYSKQSYRNLFSRKKSVSVDKSAYDEDLLNVSEESVQPLIQQNTLPEISLDLQENQQLYENESEIQKIVKSVSTDEIGIQTDQETTFAIEEYIKNNLSQYKELNFKFDNSSKVHCPELMSSSVLPWVVAAQTASRIIVDNHAKVLVENDNLRAQVTKALTKMRQVQNNDHIIIQLQSELKQLQETNQSQSIKINELNIEKDGIIVEKNKKYDQMENNLNMQIASLKTELQDLQFKYEESQRSLNQAKQIFMEEFTAKYKLSESQTIGELSRKIVYLESVQSMFTSAEVEHKNQIKHLENANAELRMYQFKFNDKLINMKQILTAQIQEQFNPYLQSLQDQKKTMNDEYELMQEEIAQLKHENNTLLVQSNDLSYQLEKLTNQQKIYKQQLCQISGSNNNYYSVNRLLRRKIEQYIIEKYRLKEKVNGMMQLILDLQQGTINIEQESRFVIETLLQKLYEVLMEQGLAKQQVLKQIQATLDGGRSGKLDEEVRNSINYQKGGCNLQYLSIIQLERLNVSKEKMDKNTFEERFYDDLQTLNVPLVNDEQQTNVVSSYDKSVQVTKNKVFVKDFSQSVKFFYGESQLLQDAYKQIDEYKALLEQKNEMQENLASFKERVFNECYSENIQMVQRTERQLAMMEEDMQAQFQRYKQLIYWRDTHHCPTIEDFQPLFDQKMRELRIQKDGEIDKLQQTIESLKEKLNRKDQQIQQLTERYNSLKEKLLALDGDAEIQSHPEMNIKFEKVSESILSLNKQLHDKIPALQAKLKEIFVLKMDRGMETEAVHILTESQYKQLQHQASRINHATPAAISSRGSSKALLRRPSGIMQKSRSASPTEESMSQQLPGLLETLGERVGSTTGISRRGSRVLSRKNSDIISATHGASRQSSQGSAAPVSRRNSIRPHRLPSATGAKENEDNEVKFDKNEGKSNDNTETQQNLEKLETQDKELVEVEEYEEAWSNEDISIAESELQKLVEEERQEERRILFESIQMSQEDVFSYQMKNKHQQHLFQFLLNKEQKYRQTDEQIEELNEQVTQLNQEIIDKNAEIRNLREQIKKIEQSVATMFKDSAVFGTNPQLLKQGLPQSLFGADNISTNYLSSSTSNAASKNNSNNPSKSRSPLSKPISISKRVRGMLRPENQYKVKPHVQQTPKSADDIVEAVLNKKNSRNFINQLIEKQEKLEREKQTTGPDGIPTGAGAAVIDMQFNTGDSGRSSSADGLSPAGPSMGDAMYLRQKPPKSTPQIHRRVPAAPKTQLTPSQQKAELIKAKHKDENTNNQMVNKIRQKWMQTKEILDKSAEVQAEDTTTSPDSVPVELGHIDQVEGNGSNIPQKSVSEQLAAFYDTYGLSKETPEYHSTPKYVRKTRPIPMDTPEERVSKVIGGKK